MHDLIVINVETSHYLCGKTHRFNSKFLIKKKRCGTNVLIYGL